MRFTSIVCLGTLFVTQPAGRADYLDDTGYRELEVELGASLPTGQGVSVSQVEAGAPDYSPEAGSGTFAATDPSLSGVTLSVKSGDSGASSHALLVAQHFYGRNRNPAASRVGFTPGITVADVYGIGEDSSDTGSWLGDGFLTPGSGPPLVETRAVQNHSWITLSIPSNANTILRRFDFAIQRDGFLAVTGVNNGAGTQVPALMASAWNNLAVGVSSGNHSSGGVPATVDGSGRQKPEIVAPLDYTSFATGLVSSAGAFLRQTADTMGGDARRPQTLKAVLLAGATKEKFPGWSRTESLPLDKLYGAGELHLGNSWHILTGGQQVANQAPDVPDKAWAVITPTSAVPMDFLLTIPQGEVGKTFSAVAVWNRIVTDANPGSGFTPSVARLADYNLRLDRLPVTTSEAGGDSEPVLVDQSMSTLENLEHIYQRSLPPGHYRLRLSFAGGGTNSPAALAWRLARSVGPPAIAITMAGSQPVLNFTGLITGQAYVVQGSANLTDWNADSVFVAESATFSWPTTVTAERRFYRLASTDASTGAAAGN